MPVEINRSTFQLFSCIKHRFSRSEVTWINCFRLGDATLSLLLGRSHNSCRNQLKLKIWLLIFIWRYTGIIRCISPMLSTFKISWYLCHWYAWCSINSSHNLGLNWHLKNIMILLYNTFKLLCRSNPLRDSTSCANPKLLLNCNFFETFFLW